MTLISLQGFSYKVASSLQQTYERDLANELNILPKWNYYSEEQIDENEAQQNKGMRNLRNLIDCLSRLDKMGYARSRHQMEFHRQFIIANLKNIMGEDLYPNLTQLIKEFTIDDIKLDVIIDTPRRFGKTTAVALFVASFLYTQPGKKVSIYSTGKRASASMLRLIKEILIKLAGTENVIVTSNSEVIETICLDGGTSTCKSYPASINIDVSGVSCYTYQPAIFTLLLTILGQRYTLSLF